MTTSLFDFIERLTVPSGPLAGQPVQLLEFQREILAGLYSQPRPRQAVISLPRKNGKTTLLASMALAELFGLGRDPQPEIYVAAADRDQASIVLKTIVGFLRYDEELEEQVIVRRSERSVEHRETGALLRCLSSDAGGKHGLNGSLIICDEVAQWPDRDLWDVLATCQGARAEPLMVAISTQASHDQHLFSELLDHALKDDQTYCYYRGVELSADWTAPAEWQKANPAMGTFRQAGELSDMYHRSKGNLSSEGVFRNLYLNQRISHRRSLVARSVWERQAQPPVSIGYVDGDRCIIGFDVSSWTDSAMVALWPRVGIIERYALHQAYVQAMDVLEPLLDHYHVELVAERAVQSELQHLLEYPVEGLDFGYRGMSSGVRWLRDALERGTLWHRKQLDDSYARVIFESDQHGNQRPVRQGDNAESLIALCAAAALAHRVVPQPTLEVV